MHRKMHLEFVQNRSMSTRTRDLLTVAMIVALAVISFVAGFFLNDVFRLRSGRISSREAEENFAVFWEAWSWIEDSYIGSLPTSKEMTYGAVRGALNTLGDPYTIFIEPVAREQERESLRGNFGGVGALVERNPDGDIILTPLEDNPAAKAGILAGDVLLGVDGQILTTEMTVEDIAQLIRGEEGTEVTLTVIHPESDEPVDIAIVREVILLPSVTHRLLEEAPTVGYIRLNRFSAESGGEVGQAIQELKEQGADKLILDLRQNGGGLLDAAIEVSDHFMSEGPVVYQIKKDEKEKMFKANDETIAEDLPLVVLVDSGTASAAEIVAGALQDSNRATLIGINTFGKGSVQLVYDLSDGSSVHVTSARWLTPNRHQIDQHGLQPDVVVEPSDDALANGRDEVLQEAVRHLNGLVAK